MLVEMGKSLNEGVSLQQGRVLLIASTTDGIGVIHLHSLRYT
ncbi:MAG TPA: hypothetical protein PLK38_03955 [Methanoregulaceae archaeon]|nr:hypothetical protein [Methanoregulaceae archaeon]